MDKIIKVCRLCGDPKSDRSGVLLCLKHYKEYHSKVSLKSIAKRKAREAAEAEAAKNQ